MSSNSDDNVGGQSVFMEEESNQNEKKKETATGMDQNIAGLLCYLAWFITGIIFLFIEKENQFIRFHALQSIIVSIGFFVINIVLTAIPIIGWAIGLLLTPLYVVIWLLMMWKAYQGKLFKLPIAGNMAEKQLNKSRSE
ncbi:hypothetical protein [Virgibacillus sp. LDC-1]|uniref:DUF4870 domain-containing protein n=1 Tax=Virgibacillus sp. LDC-1 TaxID=3039856 RepID=UPI0024DEB2A4|nr:hypothetical protein [Virgibacillus sp. LDC-1]